MVSERDLFQLMTGMDYNLDDDVIKVMTTPVLTASPETDVRYIAQLFVKQGIGALPVMEKHRLAGIISRTDILRAVMNHFKLELWV